MSPRPSGATTGSTREKIFDFVKDRILHGNPPTVREVQEAFGFRAVQSAREHLEKLVEDGRLAKQAGRSRGYTLPNLQELLSMPNPAANDQRWIPILGRVQAGAMTTATEDIEGYISFEANRNTPKPREELFALRVQGESMIGAGIYPNDVVVVRWQNTARNGDIVVAVVDDEATVKTYWQRDNRIELRPENPDFSVILPNPEELIILGKVVEMRRFFENTPFEMNVV